MAEGAAVNLHGMLAECSASVRRTFSDHVPLYLCTLSFGIVTAALVALYHLPFPLGSAIFFLKTIAKIAMLIGAIVALKHVWHLYRDGRPCRPLIRMLQRLLESALAFDRFGNIVHGLITFTPLMMMFAVLKPDIARIRPFSWDQTFMKLGIVLGGGRHYWQILQPILGHPPITVFLSMAYWVWFPVMFGCLFWQLTRPKNDLTRSQYLLSYALAWFFGGFVLAAVFSSAGPCYYDHVVGGPNPYTPLMQYLRETSRHWPVWTVETQDALWQSYLTGTGDIQGISAMPSMHLIIATEMTLLAWRTNRALGIVFTAFTFVILIGTVMLGWHYSADGLVGIALGLFFWTVAGKIASAWARDRDRLFASPVLAAPIPSNL